MRASVATGLGGGTREVLARLRAEARTADVGDLVRALVRCYRENDLLTYASAISFQVFFALIPLVLFALGLLGFLSLQELWQGDLGPELREHISAPAYELIDDTVQQVIGARHLFWVTLGALIAVWQISGAVRAVMGVFNKIYGCVETRSFWRRMWISFALAAAAGVLLLAAVGVARFGGIALDALGADGVVVQVASFVVRWAVALGLMLVVVGLMVRYAPNVERPLHWVSFGALLVVVGWTAMTGGFWWYATSIANYESIFGGLATIIVVLTYLNASVIVFLSGVQIDALVQRGLAGE